MEALNISSIKIKNYFIYNKDSIKIKNYNYIYIKDRNT